MINYKKYKRSYLLPILTFAIIFNIVGGIILKYLFFELGILPMYKSIFENIPYFLQITFLSTIYFYMVARDKEWTVFQSLLSATFFFTCSIVGVIIATYLIINKQ